MPLYKVLKYLIVFVDTFTGWIEALPTQMEKGTMLITVLIERIIPHSGFPVSLKSDNDLTFPS
jgi:hypothetical protein